MNMSVPPRLSGSLVVGVLAAVAAAAAGACHKPAPGGQAQVIQSAPSKGEARAADLAGGIRVTFDRAAAPPDQLGRAIVGPAFVIEPAVKGEARWLDARTLAFFPAGKL